MDLFGSEIIFLSHKELASGSLIEIAIFCIPSQEVTTLVSESEASRLVQTALSILASCPYKFKVKHELKNILEVLHTILLHVFFS